MDIALSHREDYGFLRVFNYYYHSPNLSSSSLSSLDFMKTMSHTVHFENNKQIHGS